MGLYNFIKYETIIINPVQPPTEPPEAHPTKYQTEHIDQAAVTKNEQCHYL